MLNLKSELNFSQYEAVTSVNGPVLVIAGAGSGKTRVIEYRVLHLVQNNILPHSILLLTFTRAASKKMLERATGHDSRCKNVEGGTFHSFAYKMLRSYGSLIGLANIFSVLDEGDSIEAVHRCVVEAGISKKYEDFPKKDTLKKIFSSVVNKNLSVERIVEREYPEFLDYIGEIEALRKKYIEFKYENGVFDYDDLLVFLKRLLEEPNVKENVHSRYRYIMVDEYQDTNRLQSEIAYLLTAEPENNIMVVGDDAQSIYGFRGAAHKNIMDFSGKFPRCKVIKLQENYRSTQSILDLANSVLRNMKDKYSKCLVSARRLSGSKPGILFFSDAYAEAGWIADKIKELRDEGVDLKHQAVLFRSAYISIPLQAELSKRNISYQVFGGIKFYETAHVKDLLAHFKVITNPRDEVSWARALMLIEGVGVKTCEKILNDIKSCPTLKTINERLFQTYSGQYKFSARLKTLLSAITHAAFEAQDTIEEQFKIILDYYLPLLKYKFDDWQLRIKDLEVLKDIASRYAFLDELLADFAIELPANSLLKTDPAVSQEDVPLTLSTIHSAKGLEWDHVFVIGLMEGVFPVSFSLNDESEIEEEHRLFYVAVTRAKNNLLLSLHHRANRSQGFQFNKVSRFVESPDILSKLERQVILEK